MTKNTDWAYETELRFATVDLDLDEREFDTPLTIPLGDCLKAVIFGDAHTAPRVIAAGIRGLLGSESPEFYQCRWAYGAPTLEAIAV